VSQSRNPRSVRKRGVDRDRANLDAVRAVESKVLSARMFGRANCAVATPNRRRLHPVSVTDRQAPSSVHRPVACRHPLGGRPQPSQALLRCGRSPLLHKVVGSEHNRLEPLR
jgi:hypothetical protein